MQQNEFTQEQIIRILQQAEIGDKPIAEICRDAGIADVTFYRWRQKYSEVVGMVVSTITQGQQLNFAVSMDAINKKANVGVSLSVLNSSDEANQTFCRSMVYR